MNDNKTVDGKGHLIGRQTAQGVQLNEKGHVVARYIPGSNRTVDQKGKNVGIGDQRQRELGK